MFSAHFNTKGILSKSIMQLLIIVVIIAAFYILAFRGIIFQPGHVYCDLFKLEYIQAKDSSENVFLRYNRVNPVRYDINPEQKSTALLLFSEAYNPKWLLKTNNTIVEPVKAFEFISDYYWKISRIGWFVVGVIFLICIIGWLYEKKRIL